MKLLVLFAGVTLCGNCLAQQNATISGTVSSKQGTAIGGAKLTAVGTRTAEKRAATSSAGGFFAFAAIPADTYLITATNLTGSDSSTTVTIAAGQNRTVLLELDPDSATTLVAIDTRATTIETTSSRLGTNITSAETAQLPVNGRTYAPLTLAAPLVVTGGTATFNDIRFNGQSGGQNEIRLDGVDASSIVSTSPGWSQVPGFLFRLQTSLDAVEEFRIDSALYPAAEGHGSGGHVELVSKSGSEEWHGSFGEYLRNNSLDARNFFDARKNSALRMNQFGGSLGGALVKSRLFVFGSGEQLYQVAGFNVVEQVPGTAVREQAAPVIQRILAGIPAGAPTADPDVNTAIESGEQRDEETTYGARIDYIASTKDRVFVRESRARGNFAAPDHSTAPRSLSSVLHSDQVVARWSRIQSAGLINEVTGGFNRSQDRLAVDTTASAAEGILVNFGDGLVTPGSLFPLAFGYPGRGASFEGRRFHLGDLVTIIHGAHSIRIGGEAGLIRMPFSILGGASYHFIDLESFLDNRDGDVTVTGDLSSRTAAQEQFTGFAQDEWRIGATVLVNIGMRYEFYTATREQNDRALLVDPFSFIARNARGGFYPVSRLGFNPRIGISWAPRYGNGDTVIRIGAGSYQAPVSPADTIQPILNGANRSFIIGSKIPDSAVNTPGTGAVSLPAALDAESFRHAARAYQYGVSVQQALPGKFVAQAAWVGNVSRHLEQWGQANPIVGAMLTGNEFETLRANTSFGAVNYLSNGGNSSFNALSLNVARRLVDNLTLGASYGWSHSIGDSLGAGDAALPQDLACLACERASNDFDIRHVFAANALYDLPFGSRGRYLRAGWLGQILGGWTTGAVLTLRTGRPVNVTMERPDEIYFDRVSRRYYPTSAQVPATAVLEENTPGGGESRPTLRPNLVPGVDPYIRNAGGLWLNPAAFSIPLPGTYGDLGRNSLRGPGFSQLDVQVSRRLRVRENHSFVLRVEAFNLFNHANFANPQANLADALIDVQPGSAYSTSTSAGFGQLVSTVGKTVGLGTSRQIQLGLRYEF
jgi:hypothetical protein